jgi:hypothetical protein
MGVKAVLRYCLEESKMELVCVCVCTKENNDHSKTEHLNTETIQLSEEST